MKKDICEAIFIHEDKAKIVKDSMLKENERQEVSNFFKVISDPTRINILMALEIDELCVCDLSYILSMTQSAVSHQLRVLRDHRLVKYRKEGKSVFYRLLDHHVYQILKQTIEHLGETNEKKI